MTTDNFKKHTVKAGVAQLKFLQRGLINRFTDKLIQTLRPLKIDSILDVGCGEGFTLDRIKKEKIGKKLEGIEYLDRAIELGKIHYPDITIKEGTIYKLPYKDNSWDLVLCTEVLEHLEDPEKAMKELFRVSKKYVLLSVPNEPWFMLGNFLRGKNLSRWGNDIEHINHWTGSSFESFVKKYGTLVSASYPLPWTLILARKI